MSDSEQDKKRNKLGYQRISIACAHCRRRKIRCLLADKDPQGRCQNCIRLKKECIFYPIDQQSAFESRSDQSGRGGVGSASSSGVSSTSPDVQAPHGHRFGRTQLPSLPPNTTHSLQDMSFEPGTFQGQYLPAERSYPETLLSNSPWPPLASHGFEVPSQSRHASPGHAQYPQYWGNDQSPGSGDFAPFPNDSAQQVRTPSMTFAATFPQSSPAQLQWHLQQPHFSRSTTFPLPAASMASSLPQYAPSYTMAEIPQQLPPASYPPSCVAQESPHMMRQMQGPQFSTTVQQSHSFITEHGDAYDYRDPQEHQHGVRHIQQGYPMNWYSSADGSSYSVDEEHSVPSHAPQPSHVVPSQRPR